MTDNKKKLLEAKQYAIKRGGECLSREYIHCNNQIEWKCSNLNHASWFSSFRNIVSSNHWCPLCGKEKSIENRKYKNALEIAQKYAQDKGGNCLSKEYLGSRSKLEWKCSNSNHPSWFISFDQVINRKTWCVHCANEKNFIKWRTEGLQNAHNYAKSRGGVCLSTEFLSGRSKLEWKCSNPNHSSWFGTYHKVTSSKSWCARCKGESVKEFKARNILNYLFNTNFINTRTLSWNINPKTGRNLELDGYCDYLKIAFEFQGDHHTVLAFGNKQSDLEDIQEKDRIKKQNCIDNNISLIVIHEIKKTNFNDFYKEILKAIEQSGLIIDEHRKNNILKIKELFNLQPINDKQKKYLKEAQNYAINKKGQCLSKNYTNSKEKLEWKCSNPNHPTWFNLFYSVVRLNRWCRECNLSKFKLNKF